MKLIVSPCNKLEGTVNVPSSKSHTHRAIMLASLADGVSTIRNPLLSEDCLATIEACRKIGAEISIQDALTITGIAGRPRITEGIINVGNSGTTIRLMSAIVALSDGEVTLTGDQSIQKRPMGPLLDSLNDLGASARSMRGDGCPPVIIRGPIRGGKTRIEGISSQFVTGLLITCQLADSDTELEVSNLKSKPYARMTLEHLKRVGIDVEHDDLSRFKIKGGQTLKSSDYTVPGDYSSAAFLMAAASITSSHITILGLDPGDMQGDKAIIEIMGMMVSGSEREIDLGDTPDLLPITAVLACYAPGSTILKNVEHARLKESDRISTICAELKKMGADIKERADGLVINNSKLEGADLDGHLDHRIVMSLAVAALGAEGPSIIDNAETIMTSFPGFEETMRTLGANIRTLNMEGDSIGKSFRLTTYGESHGDAVGAVIEGFPAGFELSVGEIQEELDRRKPGKGPLTSSRKEPDLLEIISGIKEGRSTGKPIWLQVGNQDKRSKDYDEIMHKPRPGHADMTQFQKYGSIPAGGGRASGRETIGRVLGGALARQYLGRHGIRIQATITEIGGKKDCQEETILGAKEHGDSVGGIVEIVAEGVPPGLGEPVFDKLDADLAKALMSIGGVKGVEIGLGFGSAKLTGSANNDPIIVESGTLRTRTNNAGGILGGISNGMPVVCRISVKPTSSIAKEQDTVDLKTMEPTRISVGGRHDPCICQRILPVAEAMVAIVLADHILKRETENPIESKELRKWNHWIS